MVWAGRLAAGFVLAMCLLAVGAGGGDARPRVSPAAGSPAGPCGIHIPVSAIPRHVAVYRDRRRVTARRSSRRPTSGPGGTGQPLYLEVGDVIRVNRPATFAFEFLGNRYRLRHAVVTLVCRRLLLDPNIRRATRRVVALELGAGQVEVGVHGVLPRHALVLSEEMMALTASRRASFVVERDPVTRRTRAWTLNAPIFAALPSHQRVRIESELSNTAISDHAGLRLDIWPFPISRRQRPTRPADGLVPFWDDGQECSVGCQAPGAIPGWPIEPFHKQHAIRAGINELRPSGPHVAVDIEAANFAPVYAIQSGYVSIRYMGTADVNVDVGNFDYWHIHPTVSDGQYIVAYQTELGWVLYNERHVAFSELGPQGEYINPLRPGGSLLPYTDTIAPVIGVPHVYSDGRMTVGAFDPQSFVSRDTTYETPVLAPAALAWRLYNARGASLTGLQWALRGSQVYPPDLQGVFYAPGAMNPGYDCFASKRRCIPNWVYWLAGGLTEPLPVASLPRGRYRLTVYAWDWAGNTSALDYWFTVPLAHAASAPFGPLDAQYDP